MRYLVEMSLSSAARPLSTQAGVELTTHYIMPTIERCKALQQSGKIVAGGPIVGAIKIAMVIEVESPPELDALLESLPAWPIMDTEVTALTTFDGREQNVLAIMQRLRSMPPVNA